MLRNKVTLSLLLVALLSSWAFSTPGEEWDTQAYLGGFVEGTGQEDIELEGTGHESALPAEQALEDDQPFEQEPWTDSLLDGFVAEGSEEFFFVGGQGEASEEALESMDEAVSEEGSSGTCGEGITWKVEEDVLTITGEGPMEDFSLFLPQPDEGDGDYDESRAAPWLREYQDRLVKVVIEDGVTSIGAYAFEECTFLSQVLLPKSITSIGECAFLCCKNLSSLALSDGLTFIGEQAFFGCFSLSEVGSLGKVDVAQEGTFGYCQALKSLVLPDTVTMVRQEAFLGCSGLTALYIPGSVTQIEENAFLNCGQLVLHVESGSYAHSLAKSDGYQYVLWEREGMELTPTPTVTPPVTVTPSLTPTLTPTPTPVPEAPMGTPSISLSKASKTLYAGKVDSKYRSYTLKVTTENTKEAVKFKSADKAVVKVTKAGKVKAVGPGTTTVTAYFKQDGKTYKAICTFQVKNPKLKFSSRSITLPVGGGVDLVPTVKPAATVRFSADDASIVLVEPSGTITGLKKGSSYVYVEANGLTVKILVKVEG